MELMNKKMKVKYVTNDDVLNAMGKIIKSEAKMPEYNFVVY